MLWPMLLLLLSAPVRAHAGAEITAIDWNPSGVEASFGLLLPSEQGLDWVCHEAVTTPISLLTPGYAHSPAGVWLATVPNRAQAREEEFTLYRSEDGCAWDTVAGVAPFIVSAVVWVDEQVAVGVTADLEPGNNGILRSSDGGRSWSEVQPWEGERLSVGVVASGSDVWTASFVVDAPDQAQVHHSEDGGQSWTAIDLNLSKVAPESGTLSVKVLAADEENAWVGVGVSGGHQLFRVNAQAQGRVHGEDGSLIDGGVDTRGGVWIVEGTRDLLYAEDGVTFTAIEGGIPAIGVGMDGELAMLSASAVLTDQLVFSFTPEGALEVMYGPSDVVGPLDCPAGTEGAEICSPLWSQVLLPAPDTGEAPRDSSAPDTGVDTGGPGPEGCDCSSVKGGVGGWPGLLCGALLLWRRRR